MNYKEIYSNLIRKRVKYPANLQYDYTQTHHIIPVSIDPTKSKLSTNLVILSARQHFIAHALLVKIYKQTGQKNKLYKMLCAFDAMSKLYGSIRNPELRYKNKSNSKLYEIWKVELSNYIKESGCRAGKNASMYGKTFYYNLATKKIRCFEIDKAPVGWIKGMAPWIENKQACLNTSWVHNVLTNEQRCIKKIQLEQFLIDNPDFKLGMSPLAKTHTQYYNPSEGKYWITNIELKESKRIPNEESLPEGWLYGRISNFDKFLEKYNDALTKKEKWYFIDYEKDIKENKIPRMLKNKKKLKEENKNVQKYLLSKLDTKEEKVKLLKEYLEEYKINGYKGVVKKFNYQYSRIALFKSFKKYLNDDYEEYKRLK